MGGYGSPASLTQLSQTMLMQDKFKHRDEDKVVDLEKMREEARRAGTWPDGTPFVEGGVVPEQFNKPDTKGGVVGNSGAGGAASRKGSTGHTGTTGVTGTTGPAPVSTETESTDSSYR